MDMRPNDKQMMQAIHILMKDDKEYKEELISDLTEEEYRHFIEECPEFCDDM